MWDLTLSSYHAYLSWQKPRVSVGTAASSRAQGRALKAEKWAVSPRAPLVCPSEVVAAEGLQMLMTTRRDKAVIMGTDRRLAFLFLVALPALPGTLRSPLLIQPHTGRRAPPGSRLLAWSWPPWQQGQLQPVLP